MSGKAANLFSSLVAWIVILFYAGGVSLYLIYTLIEVVHKLI